MSLFTKQKQIHRHRKLIYGHQRAKWGGIKWGKEGEVRSTGLTNARYHI